MTTATRRWYQNPRVRRFLARSEYITAFTNWFMGLLGRATELVLYATVLYSSAQLYPHVQLPAGLSLAVFLIQMGALDVGGLALNKLAKQARKEGNSEGARQAARLSQWLIGIMLAGVVTVGLEHALPFALPTWITVTIDVILVVARSICAVLYGRVVHELKTDAEAHETEEVSQQVSQLVKSELTSEFTHLRQEFSQQVSELTRMFTNQTSELTTQVGKLSQQFTHALAQQGGQLAAHEQALTGLAALPGIIERHEQATHQVLAGIQTRLESRAASKPKLSLVASPLNTEQLTPGEGELTNRQFIEDYLSKHPDARNIEVIEAGRGHNFTISQSQVSQVRKALKELSA